MEENTYFYYNKEGKRITDGNTYFPDLLKDKDTGKFKIGYYGHSNMGKFLMISGDIKDLLNYSDGQNILKEIYEKNVNMELKKDFKKAFYNNQDFNIEITLNKFKEVKNLLTLTANVLSKEDIEKNFIYDIKEKYQAYVYDTKIYKDISSYNYKVKNNLFTDEEKKFFPQEIKEATKNSYIFEKIIDFTKNNYNIKENEAERLCLIRWEDNFSSLVKTFNNNFVKEKTSENQCTTKSDDLNKNNPWAEKVNNDKDNQWER